MDQTMATPGAPDVVSAPTTDPAGLALIEVTLWARETSREALPPPAMVGVVLQRIIADDKMLSQMEAQLSSPSARYTGDPVMSPLGATARAVQRRVISNGPPQVDSTDLEGAFTPQAMRGARSFRGELDELNFRVGELLGGFLWQGDVVGLSSSAKACLLHAAQTTELKDNLLAERREPPQFADMAVKSLREAAALASAAAEAVTTGSTGLREILGARLHAPAAPVVTEAPAQPAAPVRPALAYAAGESTYPGL